MDIQELIAISAVGKTLSSINAEKLKAAYLQIGEVLQSARIISETEYKTHLANIAASSHGDCLKKKINHITWENSVRTALDVFWNDFLRLCYKGEQCGELVDSLAEVLMGLASEFKEKGLEIKEVYVQETMMSSQPEPEPEEDPEPEEVITEIEANNIVPLQKTIQVAFDCAPEVEEVAIAAKGVTKANKHPISGVLFRIDEPSEAIPAVGPGVPLYIPREVAMQLIDQVNGLPLDAHDSLRQHANKEIAGVMLSAEIVGSDFIVHGHLWPWNQSEKVESIVASANRLGMSMNANAMGHRTEVNGRKVFLVDSLELLGANILLSDHATYRKTRLLSAGSLNCFEYESEPIREEQAIAAAAELSLFTEESEAKDDLAMDIQDQFSVLTRSLTEFQTGYRNEVEGLRLELAALKADLQDIQSERQMIKAQAAQIKTEEQKAAEKEALVRDITAGIQQNLMPVIQESVTKQVQLAKNPHGQPQRITQSIPLAASGQTNPSITPEVMQLQLQLASLDGQIAGCEDNWAKISSLLDEKRNIETRLMLLKG